MARPAKPDDQKLITASTKLKPQTVKQIERIAVVEGLDVSKIVRRLIEEGMEYHEQTLRRGGQLSAQLLSRFRLLTHARQYDLLAISEALLSRQEYDAMAYGQPPPEATPLPPADPHAERPLTIDTISTLTEELRHAEADPAQSAKADLLRELIADVEARERTQHRNDRQQQHPSKARPDSPARTPRTLPKA